MGFKTYSDENPPKRGTARKIYEAFKAKGWEVEYLQYNPNCWGNAPSQGWGTWACSINDGDDFLELWCGWDDELGVYLQGNSAPFAIVQLGQS